MPAAKEGTYNAVGVLVHVEEDCAQKNANVGVAAMFQTKGKSQIVEVAGAGRKRTEELKILRLCPVLMSRGSDRRNAPVLLARWVAMKYADASTAKTFMVPQTGPLNLLNR